jgi:hypothetical protein
MGDGSIIAHVGFKNVGNLPARNVHNQVKIKWFEDGNKSDFGPVAITDPGSIVLLPKIEIERGTGPLSKEDAALYRAAEKGFIYVWGRLEYEDGFRQNRWVIFCHRYNCRKPDAYRHHHHHNDGN